jgi:peptidyl-prolyl cis-trans isomerase SurA
VLGAAGLGGCAVLAACSPVQVGSAAIVGNQRITVSSLDTAVSNLKTAEKQYGSAAQLKESAMPQAVLSWLVRFAVMDRVAAQNGITVTASQATAGLSGLSSVAQQDGASSASELLVANGIPPQLFNAVGRWEAQREAFAIKENGGTVPSTAQQDDAYNTAISKAQCTASKTLSISISPQFGRLNYSSYTVVAAADTLSRPEGKVTAASTAGLTPAC